MISTKLKYYIGKIKNLKKKPKIFCFFLNKLVVLLSIKLLKLYNTQLIARLTKKYA